VPSTIQKVSELTARLDHLVTGLEGGQGTVAKFLADPSVYDNLKKAMTYIFAIHVPIAGLSLLPVILRWPLVLLPVHIVFPELIIDPACTLVFELEQDEQAKITVDLTGLTAPPLLTTHSVS
jgi:hypothetical protein